MDLDKLTDEQIAFLLYASEKEHDKIRKTYNAKKKFVDAGCEFRNIFYKEYVRRNLHWSMFMPE